METHLAPSVPVVSEQTVKNCSYIAMNFGSLDVVTNEVPYQYISSQSY